MINKTHAMRSGLFRFGASSVALTVAMAGIAPAWAQDAATAEPAAEEAVEGEIVVTGFRAALQNAQNRKRNADTIVDSVTAEDIGALPDRSVTETLQRIPGISINRFAAGVDPDHFSVEGSGVVVRGLTYVRSEFNGREAFTANNGRALGFADVPSELLGGVDVFKSPSADRIEGGIAGVVNLRTRLPFDRKGFLLAGSVEMNYSDLVAKSSPTVSILASNTWDTGIGEIGLLGSFSYSQLFSRADRFQISGFRPRNIFQNADGSRTDTVPFAGGTQLVDGDGDAIQYLFPRGAVVGSQEFNRERYGYSAAAQWKSLDGRAEATFQFLRSDARQAWSERVVEIATDNVQAAGDSRAVAGTSIDFDEDGLFESGTITGPTGWRGDQNNDASIGGRRTPAFGLQSNNIARENNSQAVTSDYAANFKFQVTDNLSLMLDYQHVDSFSTVFDNGLWTSSYQDVALRLRGTEFPDVTFLPPQNCDGGCPPGGVEGGGPGSAGNYPSYFAAPNNSFSSPANTFYRSAMDHIEDSTGNSDAVRFDAEYSFPDDGFLKSVRAGVRYADRDQVARFSVYNWGVLSEQWGNGGPVWLDDPVDNVQGGRDGTAPNQFERECFNGFFRGAVDNPLGGDCRLFYSGNPASNYEDYIAFGNLIGREWQPQQFLQPNGTISATSTGADGETLINGGWRSLANRPNALPGSVFTPGEINPQQETNKAAYLVLRFGQDFGTTNLSGNVGVRYTTTDRNSQGFAQYAVLNGLPTPAQCLEQINNVISGEATGGLNANCALSPQERTDVTNYLNGALVPNNIGITYNYWLPSLNLKLEFEGGLIFRAAYSRAVTPPDLGLVRNFFPINLSFENQRDSEGDIIPIELTEVAEGTGDFGSNGTFEPGQVRIQGTFNAGNPELRPIEADNFDLTAEWYFDRSVGQLSASLFYKRLYNVLANGTVRRQFTNNGATFESVVTTPFNSPEVGEIKGFEISYQQTYDFLPGIFSGLGLQANYTYVDSQGVPQSTLSATDPDVGSGRVSNISGENFPLQGLSEHSFNITPFWDIGPVSMRASYNWRSDYLLTIRDVIVPNDPIFQEAYGQLDASITISATDNLKIGFQGVNLTNSVTKTTAAVEDGNGDIRRVPRGWYVNDRRYTAIVRFTF